MAAATNTENGGQRLLESKQLDWGDSRVRARKMNVDIGLTNLWNPVPVRSLVYPGPLLARPFNAPLQRGFKSAGPDDE